jgi:ABC-2 type transport system ATP-binding protein
MDAVQEGTAPVRADAVAVTGDAPVDLRGVSVFYGEVVGLSNVTLRLDPGITGIVGPNGSGKSTLMRVLTGLVAPVEGTVRVLGGTPFTEASVRSRIRLVPATECFHQSLSGRKNLEVAFLARGENPRRARELADRALEVVRLTEHGGRKVGAYSRGMRQRVKLGLALADESDLVLLDEPFLGVDPPTRRQLSDLVHLLGESGRTVLVSSHVLHEVESLTDRVGILAHGRLLGFGRIQDLLLELRDRHPHRVHVTTTEPRRLGADLVGLPHVRELKVVGGDQIEFVTDRPEIAYRELAQAVVRTGTPIRRLETLDNTLEAVFRHVTAGGTRRL